MVDTSKEPLFLPSPEPGTTYLPVDVVAERLSTIVASDYAQDKIPSAKISYEIQLDENSTLFIEDRPDDLRPVSETAIVATLNELTALNNVSQMELVEAYQYQLTKLLEKFQATRDKPRFIEIKKLTTELFYRVNPNDRAKISELYTRMVLERLKSSNSNPESQTELSKI